jgi:hypothetical protein
MLQLIGCSHEKQTTKGPRKCFPQVISAHVHEDWQEKYRTSDIAVAAGASGLARNRRR